MYHWSDLKKYIPNKFSSHYHKYSRHKLDKKFDKSVRLIQEKDKLLNLSEKKWIYKWEIVLHKKVKTNKENYLKENMWHLKNLFNEGLIIKPQNGYGGNHVHHFYVKKNHLYQEILFSNKVNIYPLKNKKLKKNYLFYLWKKSSNQNNNCIISPYLIASFKTPSSYKTPVVRVITQKKDNKQDIKLQEAWIEILIDPQTIAYINSDGIFIDLNLQPLSLNQSRLILEWKKFLEKKNNLVFKKCINASKLMHKKISSITNIAWDWIPSSPYPKLLEANAEYSLLIPQLLNFKKNEIIKKNKIFNALPKKS